MAERNQQLRKFGLVVGGVWLVLGGVATLRHHRGIATQACLAAGAALVMLALLAPRALIPVERVWMRLAAILGWINARVLLSALFVLVFVPLALMRRLLGKDSLDRAFEPQRTSYWHDRLEQPPDPQRYRRQF